MKHFAIFLCMVIGYACVDSQRVEIGDDDFKADQDARKAASLDAKETLITDDKAIRSKDDPASSQSSHETSNETEATEKLSSAAKSMNVTSEVKKSGQRTQLRKPTKFIDLLSLLNHSHRNISANQLSIGDNRSLPGTSDPIRDTSITSTMLTRWKFREERRGAQAHRNVLNGSRPIESLEDYDTYGIISQVVKGCVEAPAKIETRYIHIYQEQNCHDADRKLENYAPGYWSEVVKLRNRHATRLETSAVLRKYSDMKRKESETYTQIADRATVELYEYFESIRNGYEEGETVERVWHWFECPNKEIETRFQTWDIDGIVQLFTDLLCILFGFIGFIVYLYLVWRLQVLKAKENAMLKKKSSPIKEEHIIII